MLGQASKLEEAEKLESLLQALLIARCPPPHTHARTYFRTHIKASKLGEAEVVSCCDGLLPRGEAVLTDADVRILPREAHVEMRQAHVEMRSALFTAVMLFTHGGSTLSCITA